MTMERPLMIKPAVPPDTPEQPNTSEQKGIEPGVMELLNDPNILERVEEQMRAMGLAGDTRPSMLAYLALTSRWLGKPINLSVVGASSSGKSEKINYARDLHPPEAYHFTSASSERALIYATGSFKHRIIIMAEADSLPSYGAAASAMRSIVEDDQMIYEVTEKGQDGKFETRRIIKDGPTGLITTSVDELPTQLRTRVLEVVLEPDADEIAAVIDELGLQAEGKSGAASHDNRVVFVELQKWIAGWGSHKVVVPFARILGTFLPTRDPAIQRSYRLLLSCIKTLALLHQRQRVKNSEGQIIATLSDYKLVKPLLDSVFQVAAEDGVTSTLRATVEAIPPKFEISLTDLAKKLGKAKSSVHEQVQKAIRLGYVANRQDVHGYPARLGRKDPLPSSGSAGLPSVEEVEERWTENAPPQPTEEIQLSDSQIQEELDPQFHESALEALHELFDAAEIIA